MSPTDEQLARVHLSPGQETAEFENLAAEEAAWWNSQMQKENFKTLRQDRKQRRRYSKLLFKLIAVWLFAVGAIVFCHGFTAVPFALDDTVLITLLGTTNGAVLGLFLVVARYLFPAR